MEANSTESDLQLVRILMNGPINNLLKFQFRDGLSHRFSHHLTPNALRDRQITNQLLFQVQPDHFFTPEQLYRTLE